MSKKTLSQIVKSNNEYLVKVKRNQKKLFQEMEQICDSRKCLDSSIAKEKNRGRKEKRTTKDQAACQEALCVRLASQRYVQGDMHLKLE